MFETRDSMRPTSLIIFLAILLTTATPNTSAADDERVDWLSVDNEVSSQLWKGEKDLIDWATELSRTEPKTAREAVVKIIVCTRAGLDSEICGAVRSLGRFAPQVDNSLISKIFRESAWRYQVWDAALVLTETFAPQIRQDVGLRVMFAHFRDANQVASPWSEQKILDWLDARIESVAAFDLAEAAKPDAEDRKRNIPWMGSQSKPIDFWRRERLVHIARMGRADEELKILANAVRKNPKIAKHAIHYLESIMTVNYASAKREPDQLDWVGTVCRPARAIDLKKLAELLFSLRHPKAAEQLFRLAIDKNISDEEVRQLARMYSAFLSDQQLRLLFAVGVREKLAQCLLSMGETEKSQAVMVEAADIREKHGLPLNAHLSGMVQAASGFRVIEGRILEREKEDKESSKYWLQRSQYYCGRKEFAEQESAMRRGLAICESELQARENPISNEHNRLLYDLTSFLIRHNREKEAAKLLLETIEKYITIAPHFAVRAANRIGCHLPKHVDADEEILWRWLESRPSWETHIEGEMLELIIRVAPAPLIDKYVARMERLAMSKDADPSRAATVGSILHGMGQHERSIPLLTHAIENTTGKWLQERTRSTLFYVYLDLKSWRQAESMFERANERLRYMETTPHWLGRIAVLAAQDGAKQDAMRIWHRAANLNLRTAPAIEELSRLGLESEIKAYYAAARRRLPTARLDGIAE